MSNTKLTKSQKATLQANMRAFYQQGGMIGHSGDKRITVVYLPDFPGSRIGYLSTSIASIDEQKYRRKVGVYHALRRFQLGECIPVFAMDQDALNEFAEMMLEFENPV